MAVTVPLRMRSVPVGVWTEEGTGFIDAVGSRLGFRCKPLSMETLRPLSQQRSRKRLANSKGFSGRRGEFEFDVFATHQ